MRGVAFDREAQNVKRVRVVVVRVRPHARPNTPGAAAGGDLYKSAFRFWIAVVELFRDELFACVVPGESCDVGEEGNSGFGGVRELASQGLRVGVAEGGQVGGLERLRLRKA